MDPRGEELGRSLLRLAAAGDLAPRDALAGIDVLAGGGKAAPVSQSRVHFLLAEREEAELATVRRHLLRRLLRDAVELHWGLRQGRSVDPRARASLGALPIDPAPEVGWRELPAAIAELRGQNPREGQAAAQARAASILDPQRLLDELDLARWGGSDLPPEERDEARRRILEAQARRLEAWIADTASGKRADPTGIGDEEAITALVARLSTACGTEERAPLLDALLTFRSDAAARALGAACAAPWERERAMLVLSIRFGLRADDEWAGWKSWLEDVAKRRTLSIPAWEQLCHERPGPLLALWCAQEAELADLVPALARCTSAAPAEAEVELELVPELEVVSELEVGTVATAGASAPSGAPAEAAPAPVPRGTLSDAASADGAGSSPPPPVVAPAAPVAVVLAAPAAASVPAAAAAAPTITPVAPPPPAIRVTLVAAGSETARRVKRAPASTAAATAPAPARPPAPPPPPPEPAKPAEPPLWRTHLEAFIAQNWFLAVGLLMVVAGSSLLAYYTWDKSWALRYSLMPAMLGAFTAGLAALGGWLARKDARLAGTGALLRGAAIGLLPVNFVAIALLAGDPEVPAKTVLVPGMGLLYLVLAWAGLTRWCGAVHESLRSSLVPALLAVNALVVLVPIANAVSPLESGAAPLLVAIGFHAGFGVVVYAVIAFARRALDGKMATEQLVPAFFGATLLITFVETFLWSHALLRELPSPATYALLTVASGGVVFYLERRFLEVRGTPEVHAEVSFLGFALVILGVLLGLGSAPMRTACLAVAGAVWLHQAWGRKQAAHYGAALLLFFLTAPSVALSPAFPRAHAPLLAILLAAAFEALARIGRGDPAREDYRTACRGYETAALLIGALAAPASQISAHAPSIFTAVYLLVFAGAFVRRALEDASPRWLLTAIALAALALPWLGCVDLESRTLAGNRMALGLAGLSAIWLTAVYATGHPVLARARSTTLVLYGALAAMIAVLETLGGGRGGGSLAAEAIGPLGTLLMAGFLVVATWYTRSLVPALLALLLVGLSGPPLVHAVREALGIVLPPSGIGRASVALAALVAAFRLRALPSLAALEGAEGWMGSERPLPLVRRDATLFTTPLLIAVVLLALSADGKALLALVSGEATPSRAVAAAITAVVWTGLAVFVRDGSGAGLFLRLGWLAALGALALATAPIERRSLASLAGLSLLTAQAVWALYRVALVPRFEWARALLLEPQRALLRALGVLLGLVVTLALLAGMPPVHAVILLPLLVLELAWDALESGGRNLHGATLFCVLAALAAALGAAPSIPIVDLALLGPGSVAAAALLVAIEAVHVLLEARPSWRAAANGLLLPLHDGTVLAVSLVAAPLALGYAFLAPALHAAPAEPSVAAAALRVALVLLVARAHGSGPLLLAGLLLVYAGLHEPSTGLFPYAQIVAPGHLALLAVALAVLGEAGRRISSLAPRLLTGGFPMETLRAGAPPFLYPTAALAAIAATLILTVTPAARVATADLWIPYAASAAMALVAWSWRASLFHHLAAALLAVANVLVVRALLHDRAGDLGISASHIIALGLGATLLEGTVLALLARDEMLRRGSRMQALALALLVNLVLVAHYFAHPDLGDVTTARFAISGAMAYLAGLYFRRAARSPTEDEAPIAGWLEALWHLSLTIALWCAALLVPALRTPVTAPITMGAPLLYFYARAEMDRGQASYRRSATVLAFAVLGLHVFRSALQATIFPEAEISWRAYHQAAPATFALALVMLRLRGLGGTGWLAIYGGFAGIASLHLMVTAAPGFSPFDAPDRAALCGAGLAHFLLALGFHRSPLRTALQAVMAADDEEWRRVSRSWGTFMLACVHGLTLAGLTMFQERPLLQAPLILACASVVLHSAALRASAPLFLLGLVETLLAVHAGAVVESWLPLRYAVWAVLGIWALLVALRRPIRDAFALERPGVITFHLFLVAAVHVWLLHPASPEGLLAVALVTLLGALSPSERSVIAEGDENGAAALLLLAPVWLAYWSQAPLLDRGLEGALLPWPVLSAVAALLAVGFGADRVAAQSVHLPPSLEGRIIDQTFALLRAHGAAIHRATLWVALLSAGLLRWASAERWGVPLLSLDAAILLAACAGLVRHGLTAQATISYFAAEVCLVALFAAVRREIILEGSFAWTYAHDVWAEIIAALALAGVKELVRLPREGALPVALSLFLLPAAGLWTAITHGADPDVLLLIIGVHSVLYAFFGRHERTSPFNAAAVIGFVAFAITGIHGKLEWHTMHAYVVPTGMGVLVLLHIFGRAMDPGVRSNIRLMALVAMLGSAGYYALTNRMSIPFQAAFLGIAIAATAAGSLFRVRLYLFLGLGAVAIDLLALVAGVVMTLDRSARMTSVGVLVLLVGVAFVGGAAYYKANEERLLERLAAIRKRFEAWE